MITFKQFLNESTNDAGIFKALFIVGIPGAGKSYTIKQLSGTISPRIINIDHPVEFLSKKLKISATEDNWYELFRDKTTKMTIDTLFNYVNGMLPLFIDSTSNSTSNILSRSGILESLGYDVGMIFINTDLEVALNRAQKRSENSIRPIKPEYIEQIHKISVDNREYFRGKFKFFKEVSNNPGELDNASLLNIYRKVSSFYKGIIQNPVGTRILNKLKEENEKYLIPCIYTKNELKQKVEHWYNKK